eukprot:1915716-Amphidinium_carterae.1
MHVNAVVPDNFRLANTANRSTKGPNSIKPSKTQEKPKKWIMGPLQRCVDVVGTQPSSIMRPY